MNTNDILVLTKEEARSLRRDVNSHSSWTMTTLLNGIQRIIVGRAAEWGTHEFILDNDEWIDFKVEG